MILRELNVKDAPLMLEWMHDKDVVKNMSSNFESKTLDDAIEFINNSKKDKKNLHLAIVNDEDEYMGTVSLKKIDYTRMTAEFAITVRKCAMHKGYSWFGMKSIIEKAFDELNLESVYWCVSKDNIRFINSYAKIVFSSKFVSIKYA